MLETSARLLRLLSLFQGRRYWSGADLAERLEITSRTVRRDVDKLRQLGYPIHSAAGAEGGYQLGAGTTMPPLLLDDDEAVAVSVGLRYAATGAVEGIGEASVRALAKIEQILPPRLSRRVTALQHVLMTSEWEKSAVDAQTLSTIATACRDQELLRFRYNDHGGKATARSVEPHRLVHTGRRWYLVAWDSAREDWRTFRLDRMEKRISTGARFVPRDPPSKDLFAYVSRGWWTASPCRARIRLEVNAEVASKRVEPYFGLIEPIDEGSCYFDVGASTFEGIAMHLALLGFDFSVSEPPELVAAVRDLAARYGRATPTR
jgi:predicted DNA-binding transcriptional regulator YafY